MRLSTRGDGVKDLRGTTGPSVASNVRCHRAAAGAAGDAHRIAAWV